MFKFATDMNKTIRVLIIAILTSTVITENKYTWCKMNNTLIVPYNNVTLKNDSIIWTNGESSKKYSKSTYRKVDVGFELCICAVESCVYKCCKENEFYVHNECKVLDDSINFTFRVPKSINGSGFMEEYNESHFHIVYGRPKCLKSKYRLNPYNKSTDIFHISQTGLLIKSTNNKPVETDQYCVESFLSSNFRVLPLVCFQPKDDLVDDSIQINLVFTVALFIAYSGLILIQINFFQLHQIVCHVLAYIVQFAFLASFFWLNVMCFDLWQTFSNCKPLRENGKKIQYEKFTKHSIYAWGCPSAISIISLYIELSPHIPKSIIRPEFGRENCWFYLISISNIFGNGNFNNSSTWCKMNKTLVLPLDNVTLMGDALWTKDQQPKTYPKSAYRKVKSGYKLCICEVEQCFRKCCRNNSIYGPNGCIKRNESTYPTFKIPKFVNAFGFIGEHEENRFHILYGKPKCNTSLYVLEPQKKTNDYFNITNTGLLIQQNGDKISDQLYCMDYIYDSSFRVLPLVCKKSENLTIKNVQKNKKSFVMTIISRVALILSLICCFATFLVYSLIRELRNLHGKNLMCYVGSLSLSYINLFIASTDPFKKPQHICIVIALTFQFSFLASFFWLNVMCLDLWRTFRLIRIHTKERDSRQFIFYSIYAWGCPIIILIVTLSIELSSNIVKATLRPQFGRKGCWFYSKTAELLYYYGPIGILLTSNLLMFIYTAVLIMVTQIKNSKILQGSESDSNKNKKTIRFTLYFKLFFIMGLNWLTDIFSWASGQHHPIWRLTDIGNASQGLLIFYIFVCNKKVMKLIKKNFISKTERNTHLNITAITDSNLVDMQSL
ncbi:uncharacterized protein LOC126908587 isoform X2 [Daktulosphaira vitifoliae]|uniref:uncharacterized protein LOC126908587 isoform X2 n=1 Tax=Daktulosphaira vitifoliae TaxID=58002 RepID=UPI0021A9D438|nr:uncharacterized protein LOC126908587 isoform X2 [Daktulosphaira vitifoliae]